eukprot:6491500-Amphidinium_carterae.2
MTNTGINGIRFCIVRRRGGKVRQIVNWEGLRQGEMRLLHSTAHMELANHGCVSGEGGIRNGVDAGHVRSHGGATHDMVDHTFSTSLRRSFHS